MTPKTIQYHKVFNLGDYQNEKIGIEISLEAGDDPVKAFFEAKQYVEKGHLFLKEMPKYKRAKEIIKDPESYTGRDVKAAQTIVEDFEKNYAEFIQHANERQQTAISQRLEENHLEDFQE